MPLLSMGALLTAKSPNLNVADLSLEEFANIQISSVSRRQESLSDAAASVYPIWDINAVNGLIDFTTRHSAETQGLLVTGDSGDKERDKNLRWGGDYGSDFTFRL